MKETEKSNTEKNQQATSSPSAAAGYNPMGGDVFVPPYAKPESQFNQGELNQDIPEPTYTAPPRESGIPNTEEKQEKKPKEPYNPDMADLPKGEQDDAAEKMARYLVGLYEQIKLQGRGLIKISERKVNKLVNNGEIDPSLIVPVGIDEQKTLGEFFNFYNEQCSHLFKTTEDFKEAIIPPLTRELAKRGHGITDAQLILFLLFQDLALAIQEGVKTRMVLTDMLRFAKEHTQNSRQPGAVHTPPPPPPPPQSPGPHQSETIVQEPAMTVAVALQDQILAKHIPMVNSGDGMPQYGGASKLRKLKTVANQEKDSIKKDRKRASKVLDETRVRMQSTTNVPDGKKRKAGRPAGSKNKFKKP